MDIMGVERKENAFLKCLGECYDIILHLTLGDFIHLIQFLFVPALEFSYSLTPLRCTPNLSSSMASHCFTNLEGGGLQC